MEKPRLSSKINFLWQKVSDTFVTPTKRQVIVYVPPFISLDYPESIRFFAVRFNYVIMKSYRKPYHPKIFHDKIFGENYLVQSSPKYFYQRQSSWETKETVW